ncbi:origin recognition complex subunit 1 [Linepithema humile]|uniref:origin recognition complex subunit 1 n=1 Tax=Linepithema humile TaxID=83485 RepID=UPI0006235D7C|nr:PREDICTED: origin recognition complex subunit 1 [Linepithema humile]
MSKFKKYTEKDISMLLETNSDSEVNELDESYEPRKTSNNNFSDSSSSEAIIDRKSYVSRENRDNFDSSNSEAVFDSNKSLLSRINKSRKEQVSLRLKLRRSTEQSAYKIDTESEDEKPTRPRRSTRNVKYVKSVQDENQMPRKGRRIIKVPKRYSEYECFSPKSQTSILQREHINYNEKTLLLASLDINEREEEATKLKVKNDNFSSDSDGIIIGSNPSTHSKRLKGNKRNVSSVEDINDNATSKIIRRTKSLKHISVDEEFKKDNVLVNKKTTNSKVDVAQHVPLDSTPKRRPRIEKRHRSILITPNKSESTTYKDESKTKVNEVDAICEVTKDLSIKTKQTNKNVKNTTESLVIQNGLSTPKSHRTSLKHSTLTPSMKMRTEALVKPATPLQEARSRLHVSAVPKSLPCREEEFNNIYTFLEGKLIDKSGGCIYISGVPGTGKTATVNEVIKCLKRSVEKGKLKDFDFVNINGMKLSEPRQAYVHILKQLSGKVLTWEQAHNALEKRFNSNAKKRPMTLLLVDELDLLCTKRQDVIYNLLDWPTKASAQLVVITIANTMDLPERVFMSRVTSRLGLTRITFQPYNHKQLQEIVLTRLKDTNSFKSEAIQLIARKVSAVSGDARRALEICRRATEITERRNGATVTMQDVNETLSEMIANSKVQAIRYCSRFEQIFLQAVHAEVTRTGVEEVCFTNVYKQFESLCSFDGLEKPNITQTFDICTKLGDYRLLICEYSGNDIYQRIMLNISKDDIHYALQKIDSD